MYTKYSIFLTVFCFLFSFTVFILWVTFTPILFHHHQQYLHKLKFYVHLPQRKILFAEILKNCQYEMISRTISTKYSSHWPYEKKSLLWWPYDRRVSLHDSMPYLLISRPHRSSRFIKEKTRLPVKTTTLAVNRLSWRQFSQKNFVLKFMVTWSWAQVRKTCRSLRN